MTPTQAIHIQWSDDGQHIRKWAREPFDGSQAYCLSAACEPGEERATARSSHAAALAPDAPSVGADAKVAPVVSGVDQNCRQFGGTARELSATVGDLQRYANHLISCDLWQKGWMFGEPVCTCGLDAVRRRIAAAGQGG